MVPIREIAGIRYGVCDRSDVSEMVTLLGEVFTHFDPPAVAVGLTAAEFEAFVRLFAAKAGDDGLTIVARAADSREMIGALLTEESASAPPAGIETLSPKFDPIFDILGQLDTDYRRGNAAQSEQCLHLALLGVAPAFGGRGVAQQLVSTCLENGRQRGYQVAVTEATNRVSQHVFRKLGFVDRVSRSYRDHRFDGRAAFASIEEHVGPILMDKSIP